MSSININTSQTGTYKITYKATDESSNITNKSRNIYILPNVTNPSIVLKNSSINMTREIVSAAKPGSNFIFEDNGYIAHDPYGNSSEDFAIIKHNVTTEHRRHADKNDSEGILIYRELNGVETIPNVTDSGKISAITKPQYLYLFNFGNITSFYDSNWTPSDSDPQTAYFTIKYILSIAGYTPVSVTRRVYIIDVIAPIITLATVSNPEEIVRFSNFTDSATFNTQENYWYFDNEQLPANYQHGISMPSSSIAGSIIIRDPSNQTATEIDTSILGTWKIYYTFFCIYNSVNINGQTINGANYVNNSFPLPNPNIAIGNPLARSYVLSREIEVGDNVPPIIELKQIGNGSSNPINFGSNNSGKIYTENDAQNGNHYNLYFWIPENSSTKPSLEDIIPNIHVIGEFGSTNIPSGNAEIVVRDNAGSSQNFTISSMIVTPPNISIPPGITTPQILRSSIGTDFNDDYDYNYFPIAGTVSNPAIYTIVYIVRDESNNTSNISRRLYVIDRTIPEVVFNTFQPPISTTSITDGIVVSKKVKTTGQPANTVIKFSNNSLETTFQDEFGDIISTNISYQNPPTFINSYPKMIPQNVFLLSYNTSTNKYEIKTFYNLDVDTNPLLFSTKEITFSEIPNRSVYTIYYFDVSHSSLSNRPPLKIEPDEWNNIKGDTYIAPNQYTPQGTYHSYFTCDFLSVNESDNYDGYLHLKEYVNGIWQPISESQIKGTLILKTYNPNTTNQGGGFTIR